MRRRITTIIASFALVFSALNAQVVFDPATYPVDSLQDGMSIVEIEGKSYLKAALNGWNSYVKIWDVVVAPGHTQFMTEVMYKEGNSGFTYDQVNTFLKLSDPSWSELVANGSGSNTDFHTRTINGLKGGDTIGVFQIAGQETTSWGAVTGDTLFIGQVVARNPNALIDPLLVCQDSLPAAWTVDTIDGLGYFKVTLEGWGSAWNFVNTLDSIQVPENVTAYKTMAMHKVGTGGFDLASIMTFIKFISPGGGEVPTPMKANASDTLTKYNSTLEAGAWLGTLQVAGQETVSWGAVAGDTLWIGMVEAEFSDSLMLTSEGEATSIDTPGGTLQLTATLYPEDVANKAVAWESSADTIATVSENGLVTAVANGMVTITATASDGSANVESMDITISNQSVLIESIVVTGEGDATSIDTKGGTLQMSAAVTPAEADASAIEWSSSDDGIASIDASTGLLTAVSDGTVTVTATATDGSGITGTLDITISMQSAGIDDLGLSALRLYPMPVRDILIVENAAGISSMDMVDLNGQVLRQITVTSERMSIDLSELADGVYFLRTFGDQGMNTYKIVK